MKNTTNKKLLIAFVLSAALCAVVRFVDITMVLFALVLPFFCLQLLWLRTTKKLYLRLLPTLPIVLLLSAAGYYALFGKGWDALAALIFSLLSIAPIVGCGAAVLVYLLAGRFRPRKWLIVILVLLGWCGAWMGQEISLGYWDRAFIKILCFAGCIGLYQLLNSPLNGESRVYAITEPFRFPDRASLKISGLLALAVFLFLTVGYMILSPWIDLSAIPEKLRDSDITAEDFPVIALYITLINSLLEELFFRGFAFLTLRGYTSARFAYLFSGLTFALYHVSILDGWFHPVWFVLFLIGLAVGGMLFDWLDRKGSIWCGWLVHAAADAAIMLIGMRMFGIF